MAEYFLKLEDDLRVTRPDVEFHYFVLYPCAYLSVLSAKRPVQFVCPKKSLYSDVNTNFGKFFEKGVSYHEYILGAESRIDLQKLYKGYVAFFEKKTTETIFNGAIVVGDSRLSITAASQVLDNKKLPLLHWEQGPFQTTQLNGNGVNANASFVDVDIVSPSVERYEKVNIKRSFKRTITSRAATWLTNRISDNRWPSSYFPIDRINTISSVKNEFNGSGDQVTSLPKGAYIYMLQVPYDNQIIEHGGIGRDVKAATELILRRLEPSNLLIRQHPIHRSLYPKAFYDYCQMKGIKFVDDVEYSDVLENAEGVIVANSTAGAEAMEKGKKVLILGEAFYSHKNWSYTIKNEKNYLKVLDRFLSAKVYDKRRSTYIQTFVKNNFFSGHYLYEQEIDPRLIEKIITYFH